MRPQKRTADDIVAYEKLESVPEAPDLASIAGPRDKVPAMIYQLGKMGAEDIGGPQC